LAEGREDGTPWLPTCPTDIVRFDLGGRDPKIIGILALTTIGASGVYTKDPVHDAINFQLLQDVLAGRLRYDDVLVISATVAVSMNGIASVIDLHAFGATGAAQDGDRRRRFHGMHRATRQARTVIWS
jgi:hypothetical protein